MISRTTPLWTHYINPIIKGLPNWWTIISRTTPLMDALYKLNNIQDYPIGGHIMACKLLSLELHTLFGVSYGRYIRHGLYLNVD